MKCPECGSEVKEGAKFCGVCGTTTGAAGAGTQAAQSTQAARAAPSAQPPTGDRVWLIHVGGQNHGPYTTSELAGYIGNGKVHPATHVWKEGMSGWIKASELPEFASATPTAAQQQPQHSESRRQMPTDNSSRPAKTSHTKPDSTQDEDVLIDTSKTLKYSRAKSRRERKEEAREAKKRAHDDAEHKKALRVAKTREGKEIQFYEGKPFVLLFLVVLPPAGIILLFLSRKFSGLGKVFMLFLFGFIWGITAFFYMNPNLVPGAKLDMAKYPSQAFAEESYNQAYNSITKGMRYDYVRHILGDPIECKIDKRPIVGNTDLCTWTDKFDKKRVIINIYMKKMGGKELVVVKSIEEVEEF